VSNRKRTVPKQIWQIYWL